MLAQFELGLLLDLIGSATMETLFHYGITATVIVCIATILQRWDY